ncbi:MAG: hypothetical protein AAGA54_18600 [Myxococcota bacterium]
MTIRPTPSVLRPRCSWKLILCGLGLSWLAAASVACGDEEDAESCSENETQECVCANGMGAQTCDADGMWGACSCGSGSGDSGNGSGNGSGSGSNSGSGDSGNSDSGSSSSQSCCLNGSFFSCPDDASANICFSNGDPSGCAADPSRNSECGSGDDGNGDDGNGDGGTTCSDPGGPCNGHGDCCDNDVLCVEGTCSAACDFDSECVSGCCADLEGGGGACAPAQFC